ncbi:hypothetical protein BV898_01851 [Hypsibius exemplaris]|uniref:Uncharacterized protein n=1 Tax=Hypsibius exemplaris TaxID=2072580 RepID=A0A1W0XAG5_HYPEX|nr:hypothetical protein BV898_01851 [Hypsibius exemplaris]
MEPGEQRSTRAGLPTSQSLLSFTHLQRLTTTSSHHQPPKWFTNASIKWFSMFALSKPAVVPLGDSDGEDAAGGGGEALQQQQQTTKTSAASSSSSGGASKKSLLRRVVVRPSQSVITNLNETTGGSLAMPAAFEHVPFLWVLDSDDKTKVDSLVTTDLWISS